MLSSFKSTAFVLLFLLQWPLATAMAQQKESAPVKVAEDVVQGGISKVDYRSPVDIPIHLSGNFGELRHNHYHSGIDITTGGVEGLPAYACEDGWVSRIKVSPWGFGNALYITHPDGLTMVYAHLREFEGPIAAFADSLQRLRQQNSYDYAIKRGELPVIRGQVVARTGNTGSSRGPHLHFEVRRGDTPLNPQAFGFVTSDDLPPQMGQLYLYSVGDGPVSGTPEKVSLIKNGRRYTTRDSIIEVPVGRTGIGIDAWDKANGRNNRNGVYSLRTSVNGEHVFSFSMDSVLFHESRYMNAHIDYKMEFDKGTRLHRCFRLPGDRSSLYHDNEGDGTFLVTEDSVVQINLELTDLAGNSSELSLRIRGVRSDAPPMNAYRQKLSWGQENYFYDDEVILSFPEPALYEDLYFQYRADTLIRGFSHIHHLHDASVPVHEEFMISILPIDLPPELESKALIVRSNANRRYKSLGGRMKNGYLQAASREFGSFYIQVDTVSPRIKPLNISEGRNMRGVSRARFSVSDNLSGLKDWSVTIDGTWYPIVFDAKKAVMSVDLTKVPATAKGETHLLLFKAVDEKDNLTVIEINFKN